MARLDALGKVEAMKETVHIAKDINKALCGKYWLEASKEVGDVTCKECLKITYEPVKA